jgi:hypothetical protein
MILRVVPLAPSYYYRDLKLTSNFYLYSRLRSSFDQSRSAVDQGAGQQQLRHAGRVVHDGHGPSEHLHGDGSAGRRGFSFPYSVASFRVVHNGHGPRWPRPPMHYEFIDISIDTYLNSCCAY